MYAFHDSLQVNTRLELLLDELQKRAMLKGDSLSYKKYVYMRMDPAHYKQEFNYRTARDNRLVASMWRKREPLSSYMYTYYLCNYDSIPYKHYEDSLLKRTLGNNTEELEYLNFISAQSYLPAHTLQRALKLADAHVKKSPASASLNYYYANLLYLKKQFQQSAAYAHLAETLLSKDDQYLKLRS